MMIKKRLIVLVEGGVEPSFLGPFKSQQARNTAALERRNKSDQDGIFWLNVYTNGKLEIGSYSAAFMEDK